MLLQVAAFVLGRGALTLPLTLFQFTAVMLAPFMPAEIAADKVAAAPRIKCPSGTPEQHHTASLEDVAAVERTASGDSLSAFTLAGKVENPSPAVCSMFGACLQPSQLGTAVASCCGPMRMRQLNGQRHYRHVNH
jgi:hypothetical protein